MSKILVVGANHAGTACINTMLDTYGSQNEVIVFDRNSNISFLGCGMALWIGRQIDGYDGLFYASKEGLEKKGAKIMMETEVSHIDFDKKIAYAKTADGKEIQQDYDKLILATGSVPVVPPIPGKDLENVEFVKLFQNAQTVIDKLENPAIKRVAVVGAGYIGVELAEAFKRCGREVVMIDIAPTCLSAYYDKEFTEMMEENLKSNGIELAFDQKVTSIEGNGKVERIVTDKASFDVDMVCLAVGFKPNTQIGKEKLELFKNGSYVVNKNQETSIKDVYAIGDCATVYDNALQDKNYIALATNAVRSGIVGAHNACGTNLPSIGVQGSNGICIYDLKMVSTGMTVEKAKKFGFDPEFTLFEDYQRMSFMKNHNEKVKIKIVYDKKTRRILGCQIASKEDISMAIHMFSLAIQEGVTIDKLALLDIFFLPHFNQPYNYITMAAISAK